MGCCNDAGTALATAAPDPTQHVNYAKGMVLGVDDFTQEYAYLASRGQWLAREAVGYGTTSGLRVLTDDDGANGPRLHVAAGTAIVPSGKMVCVSADQCATLNKWLAKRENAAIVTGLLRPAMSPELSPPIMSPPVTSPPVTSGQISLYLTLCYADCTTRPVPVPGEPCRSDDQLMADSRVADDFRLELRRSAPIQTEEDALREFVQWIAAGVEVVGSGSPPNVGDDVYWLEALRTAMQSPPMSPPTSPPCPDDALADHLTIISPPITVSRGSLGEFTRVALRFWATEVRPRWMAWRCHSAACPDSDCVLLARVAFEVIWVGGSPVGAWQVVGNASSITIDEAKRPVLTPLRFLQEWTSCGPLVVNAQ